MRLLRAELLKLTSVRTTWVMLGIGLLIEALFAGLYVGLAPAAEIGDLDEIQSSTGMLMVMLLVLGVLAITTEFRHGTANATFLVTPRRHPVLVAKLAAALLLGLAAGLLYVAVNAGLALPQYSNRVAPLPDSGEIVSTYAGVVVSFALLCAYGLGIGAVVRNQVGAIIAALATLFVISPLPELLPGNIGDYFPAQAIGSLHGMPEGDAEDGLGQLAGGLVLSAWAFGLWLLGTVMVGARDVGD